MKRYKWHDKRYGPQTERTAWGDRLHWSRHFPGVYCWSVDIFTRRGALCLSFGKPVWMANKPLRREPGFSVTVHAGKYLFGFRTSSGVIRFRRWAELDATVVV